MDILIKGFLYRFGENKFTGLLSKVLPQLIEVDKIKSIYFDLDSIIFLCCHIEISNFSYSRVPAFIRRAVYKFFLNTIQIN